jgi:hypothetical protein
MAKIHEELIVIKLSKLVKDSNHLAPGALATADVAASLEAVVQELVGSDVIVEVAAEHGN